MHASYLDSFMCLPDYFFFFVLWIVQSWIGVEIMGTPYPHGMVIRLVIGDNLYIWNM